MPDEYLVESPRRSQEPSTPRKRRQQILSAEAHHGTRHVIAVSSSYLSTAHAYRKMDQSLRLQYPWSFELTTTDAYDLYKHLLERCCNRENYPTASTISYNRPAGLVGTDLVIRMTKAVHGICQVGIRNKTSVECKAIQSNLDAAYAVKVDNLIASVAYFIDRVMRNSSRHQS